MMVISIWHSRPTTRERAPLTGRMEFPAFERLATTYKKFRMRTKGQVRGDLQRTCSILAPSAKTWNPPAASFFPTTKSLPAHRVVENFAKRKVARMADV